MAKRLFTRQLPFYQSAAGSVTAPWLRCVSPLRSLSTSGARYVTYRRFPSAGDGGAPLPSSSSAASLGALVSRFGGGGKGRGGGGASAGMDPKTRIAMIVLLGGGGTYFVFHLEKEPHTGRWRFIDVSPAQERAMGESTYREILQQYRGRIVSPSDPRSRTVRRVAERLVAALEQSDVTRDHPTMLGQAGVKDGAHDAKNKDDTQWEVFLVKDDEQANAFVLPNGKIFVFTGILPICKGEDGIATVLGHEISHQLARHSAEKASGTKILLVGDLILQTLGVDIGLSRIVSTLLLSLPNSRKIESEADTIGLQLMAKACYDPTEATHLWERMEAAEGGSGGILDAAKGLISTHPVNRKRIANIQAQLPEAIATREDASCPSSASTRGFGQAAGVPLFSGVPSYMRTS